jgi:ectoine hydroxylase
MTTSTTIQDPKIQGPLTAKQVADFERDGFLLVQQLLSSDELSLLQQTVRADQRMHEAGMDVRDTKGRRTNLSLWNHPGDDIYGAIARSERVINAMEQLLGGEVYHYHSKLSAKEPRVGGAWEWHQDYGYWYQNGCLFPEMASLFIAIDACTRANGCLQVLVGSHRMGRIEHGRFGDQTGADPERVARAMERLELRYCEMPPGAGLYFHSNLLHCSAANESEHPRWGLLCCYNRASNDPYKEHHHPCYTPLVKLPDAAILATGARGASAGQKFLKQEEDQTVS